MVMLRAWIQNAALLAASAVVCFFFGEIGLRLSGYNGEPRLDLAEKIRPVDDPILNWRYRSNFTHRSAGIDYSYNERGFRDIASTIAATSTKPRLVVLGDSVTDGYGIRLEEMFTSHLRTSLGARYEVVNLAQGGLNSPQEIRLFELEGAPLRPSVLVWNFVLNDFDFYSSLQGIERYHTAKDGEIGLLGVTVNPRIKQALKSSALIYFAKERVENLIGRMKGTAADQYYLTLWRTPNNRARVTTSFDRMKQLQRSGDFDVRIVVWPILTRFSEYPFGEIHQWLRAEAEQRGFEVLDLLEPFSKAPYRKLQLTAEDSVHPNGTGHLIAARSFINWFNLPARRTTVMASNGDSSGLLQVRAVEEVNR